MTAQPAEPIDLVPVIAGLQDQIDDLVATITAQQSAIDALTTAVDATLHGRRR